MSGIEPVQVHVVADSTQARPRQSTRGAYGTFLLTAADSAQQILPPVTCGRDAVIMALDTDIVISDTLAAAAGGYGTTIPAGTQWIIKDESNVYAGATLSGSDTSRVSVSAFMAAP